MVKPVPPASARAVPLNFGSPVRAVESASAARRLGEALRFLDTVDADADVLLVGASRGAVDELARTVAVARGATFGLRRFSFTQLAAHLAAADLASRDLSPITALGHEAIAARATFEAIGEGHVEYFAPVSRAPGFPRALARTLVELRLARVASDRLGAVPRSGSDLGELAARFDALLATARASDRASLFDTATRVLGGGPIGWTNPPLVLLDVPFDSETEEAFLAALIQSAPRALVTVPFDDTRAIEALGRLGVPIERLADDRETDLSRIRTHLFASQPPAARAASGEHVFFSAPGEGRESVEIARLVLKEAQAGVRFDEIAVLLRSPQQYLGLLEYAFTRAGIPAYFDRGTRRPDPAGRAFLAILGCAVEDFSARRFAEYLSLGQVPSLDPAGAAAKEAAWVAPDDEAFGVVGDLAARGARGDGETAETVETQAASDATGTDAAVVAGALRAPWKWETLLVEAAVIGGGARWARRLRGLAESYRVKIRELKSDEPGSPRIPHLERERQNLDHLRAFALPLVELMSGWPGRARWGDWIARLETFAPRVLRWPWHVQRVLADLRPMGEVGPVTLAEVRDVLADRLLTLEVDPPSHRYGAVFIGSPHQARGRAFRVVFVPGLAERLFPQKVREDPMLLDTARDALSDRLARLEDRSGLERLLLRLAAGAATDRLYLSYPRIETMQSRPRVPSFYALEVARAVTGRIPNHEDLEQQAAAAAGASLAWPAPARPDDAIDDFEHDLAVLRGLFKREKSAKGHAQYLLRLNECLRRSVTERWARSKSTWSQFDGIVRATDAIKPMLANERLGARPYSVSSLQRYATCPYQFLLYAIYRLSPLEEPEPLQRMDPLTKGSLFHQVQAEFFRALQTKRLLPLGEKTMTRALETLDETLDRVSKEYYDDLAPAIDRVWEDEVASVRTDLRIWARGLAASADWEPWLFEFAFGLPDQPGHDPKSVDEPVRLDNRFLLRGSIDLVERKRGTTIARVTDHKTGKYRLKKAEVIGGGTLLQPVIYSLVVEAATDHTVESARFSYCTNAGGFTEHVVPITERTRRTGIEALEIVDRAVELGFLAPAPAEKACGFCDYLPVCGSAQERRVKKKSQDRLGDLIDLRSKA